MLTELMVYYIRNAKKMHFTLVARLHICQRMININFIDI